mmetsp:Transcript_2764/g.4250  ORF Transcript_2764/g.4250 Transcript_2764/m.4250 type:complete len:111 (-) Transcript_2764:92-424(-)|eukprot:CAMPEP_0174955064 /NCGR_PEP_ID=MMETSP0004_2-20121128/779_1 /TAXON_ID=420556 /ORGANISM="Ochromonas sp., Strain CCMP1393" /LENGTH=110 /DNA_ID=CAMNT_0016202961 /DNA_START=89 /DNA_END=424 /DNA_ORIENTATION=-
MNEDRVTSGEDEVEIIRMVYKDGYPTVEEQVAKIKSDIARRKKELEDDLVANTLVEDRIITGRFAQIQGLKRHLNKARQTKAMYNMHEVKDPFGHGDISRGQLHRRHQKS